jgi:hypothetical protein
LQVTSSSQNIGIKESFSNEGTAAAALGAVVAAASSIEGAAAFMTAGMAEAHAETLMLLWSYQVRRQLRLRSLHN